MKKSFVNSKGVQHNDGVRINTITERATKYRRKAGLTSTNKRKGSDEIIDYVHNVLLPAGATTNDSLQQELTTAEIAEMLEENRGTQGYKRRKWKRAEDAAKEEEAKRKEEAARQEAFLNTLSYAGVGDDVPEIGDDDDQSLHQGQTLTLPEVFQAGRDYGVEDDQLLFDENSTIKDLAESDSYHSQSLRRPYMYHNPGLLQRPDVSSRRPAHASSDMYPNALNESTSSGPYRNSYGAQSQQQRMVESYPNNYRLPLQETQADYHTAAAAAYGQGPYSPYVYPWTRYPIGNTIAPSASYSPQFPIASSSRNANAGLGQSSRLPSASKIASSAFDPASAASIPRPKMQKRGYDEMTPDLEQTLPVPVVKRKRIETLPDLQSSLPVNPVGQIGGLKRVIDLVSPEPDESSTRQASKRQKISQDEEASSPIKTSLLRRQQPLRRDKGVPMSRKMKNYYPNTTAGPSSKSGTRNDLKTSQSMSSVAYGHLSYPAPHVPQTLHQYPKENWQKPANTDHNFEDTTSANNPYVQYPAPRDSHQQQDPYNPYNLSDTYNAVANAGVLNLDSGNARGFAIDQSGNGGTYNASSMPAQGPYYCHAGDDASWVQSGLFSGAGMDQNVVDAVSKAPTIAAHDLSAFSSVPLDESCVPYLPAQDCFGPTEPNSLNSTAVYTTLVTANTSRRTSGTQLTTPEETQEPITSPQEQQAHDNEAINDKEDNEQPSNDEPSSAANNGCQSPTAAAIFNELDLEFLANWDPSGPIPDFPEFDQVDAPEDKGDGEPSPVNKEPSPARDPSPSAEVTNDNAAAPVIEELAAVSDQTPVVIENDPAPADAVTIEYTNADWMANYLALAGEALEPFEPFDGAV